MPNFRSFFSLPDGRLSRSILALAFCQTLLMFVWSITGTIALRHFLMLLLIIALAVGTSDRGVWKAAWQNLGVRLLLVLSGWIVLHNLVLAWSPARSWYESQQWLLAMISLALGVGLVAVSQKRADQTHWRLWIWGIAAAWGLHLTCNIVLKDWSGSLRDVMSSATRVGTRDMVSYLGTGLLALLFADAASCLTGGRRLFPVSSKLLVAGVILAILLTAATLTRNALPVMALEVFISIIALIVVSPTRELRIRRGAMAAGVFALVMAMGVGNLLLDSRWASFSDSVRIGWDIDHYQWWLDEKHNPKPMTPRGVPVDDSAYSRAAWGHGVVRMIAHNPLGTGYDRNAFRRALEHEYGDIESPPGHAHAGVFDFTLATGIPGGVMLVAAFCAIIGLGWRVWLRQRNPAGLALALFVSGYLLRAFVDGIVRDHMLEQALFVTGVLLAASLTQWKEDRT